MSNNHWDQRMNHFHGKKFAEIMADVYENNNALQRFTYISFGRMWGKTAIMHQLIKQREQYFEEYIPTDEHQRGFYHFDEYEDSKRRLQQIAFKHNVITKNRNRYANNRKS